MSKNLDPKPGEAPGSYVNSDMGIDLPTEKSDVASPETYEGVRDNEQLGRPREEMLRQVEELAPPPLDDVTGQSDQPFRQGGT